MNFLLGFGLFGLVVVSKVFSNPSCTTEKVKNKEETSCTNLGLSVLPVTDIQKTTTVLLLSYNNFKSISTSMFKGFNNLVELEITDNGMTKFDIDIPLIIEELNLANNSLRKLPKVSQLSALTKLVLSNNQIVTIQEDAFMGLKRLTHLELQHNQINSLPEKVFMALPSLGHLDLSYNQLWHLPDRLLSYSENLNILYLSGNRLTEIPDNFFEDLEMSYVYLEKNPWNCNCALLYFKNWLEADEDRVYVTSKEGPTKNQRSVVCSDGTPLIDHDMDHCSIRTKGDINAPPITEKNSVPKKVAETTTPTIKESTTLPTTTPTIKESTTLPTTTPTIKESTTLPTMTPTIKESTTLPTTTPTSQKTTTLPTTSPTTQKTTTLPTTTPTTQKTTTLPTTPPTTQKTTTLPTTPPTTQKTTTLPTTPPTTQKTTTLPTTQKTTTLPTTTPTTQKTTTLPTTTPTTQKTTTLPTTTPTTQKTTTLPTTTPTTQKTTTLPTTMTTTETTILETTRTKLKTMERSTTSYQTTLMMTTTMVGITTEEPNKITTGKTIEEREKASTMSPTIEPMLPPRSSRVAAFGVDWLANVILEYCCLLHVIIYGLCILLLLVEMILTLVCLLWIYCCNQDLIQWLPGIRLIRYSMRMPMSDEDILLVNNGAIESHFRDQSLSGVTKMLVLESNTRQQGVRYTSAIL
ncbi:platelet glycoprotein Ib alpha chain isoform 1-T3 [Anomaloglossus baeobatrachus]|uniref:uncharacterized protein LOC142281358 n=1 Tax=Anomaloglossus baeobatrachus TaxID=238106 RepID=UPI003F5032D4